MAVQKKSKYTGLLAYSKGSTCNVRDRVSTSGSIILVAPRTDATGEIKSFGTLTGLIFNQGDYTWYNVAFGSQDGWVRNDVITTAQDKTLIEAQNLISTLVKNDEQINKSLIRSLVIIKNVKASGKLTNAQVSKFNSLLTRLTARQQKMRNSTALKVQAGASKYYNELMESMGLSSLKISGIGVVPVVVWIVAAVVVAGAGSLVTASFLGAFKESASDLQISADLEKALSSLDPAAAEAVKANLQEQIDEAYKEGKASGSSSTMWGNIKTLGLLLVGAFVADKFLNKSR